MAMAYRADIDGLRAISVLAILFFHAGLSGFPGGFVGVDIFFVISGFLITRGIHEDIEQQRFTIAKFYERRIRRILPALIVMLAATSLIVALVAYPSEMRDYVPTLFGALLFSSNIVFWKQSDYFAPIADEKPLLHTWSLGVEEQFYIFIPLLMLVIARRAPRWLMHILVAGTLLSFGLAIVMTIYKPTAAFYLLPSRAWELLLGACVGLGLFPSARNAMLKEGLPILGLFLIVGAILLFDSRLPFPAPAAVIPVLGSALLLAYGAEGQLMRPIMTNAPMRFAGKISYSLYLWHWPLIVFARLYGYVDNRPLEGIAISALSILLGWLSWRFIEQPFRDRQRVTGGAIFRFAGVSMAGTLAYACALLATDGWPSRFSREEIAFETVTDFSPMRSKCHAGHGVPDPSKACVLGGTTPRSAVWADSHGVELSLALSETQGPLRTITYSACGPALGWSAPDRPDCKAHNDAALAYLKRDKGIEIIFLTTFFRPMMSDSSFLSGFLRSVSELRAAGKTVVVIGPTPAERPLALPKIIARQGDVSMDRDQYERNQARVIAFMDEVRRHGARIWMPADEMCDQNSCILSVDGKAVLFDNHHLSMAGARYLAARMKL